MLHCASTADFFSLTIGLSIQTAKDAKEAGSLFSEFAVVSAVLFLAKVM